MEKIFTMVKVPEEKKLNIGTFYLAGEAYIWWSTVKDNLQGPKLACAKFLEELMLSSIQSRFNGRRRRNL